MNRKKTGGRSKGTPNKSTQEFRNVLKFILENKLEQIDTDLETLTPYQRLEMICRLMSFCIPKPMDTMDFNDNKIEFVITKGDTIL